MKNAPPNSRPQTRNLNGARSKRPDGLGIASPGSREYVVGYGKPPTHSQFKRGKSGNPKGRRRRSKNIATTLQDELRKRISVTENGKQRAMTKLEAIIKQLVNKAATGDVRGIQKLIQWTNELGLLDEDNEVDYEFTMKFDKPRKPRLEDLS